MTTKEKKIIALKFVIIFAVAALSWFVLYGIPMFFETETAEQEYEFYPADYERDVENVSEYRDENRYLNYTYGAETFTIPDEQVGNYGEDVRFFHTMFKAVMSGDADSYNELFSEDYLSENGKKEKFAPQMLYDMNIEKLSEKEENGIIFYYYNVSYKIFRNDGTFRDDIPSDASRMQRFTLSDKDGTIRIEKIQYYVQ